jgi:hypothetical protein
MSKPEKELRDEFAGVVQRQRKIAHEADLDPTGKKLTKKLVQGQKTAK